MFAADLSWQVGESVGQRKERKARERSSGTPSVRTSVTSRSSGSGSTDRQEWWTAGLNKIKAKSSKSSTKRRPVTSPSSSSQQRADPPTLQPVRESIARDFPTWELELPQHLKESPLPKPAYTFSKTLSPTLPSGGSMDISECDVPELEGDISSRYTHSIVSVSSRDHHWEVKTPPAEAMIGVDGVHAYDPYSLASIDTRTSVGSREPKELVAVPRDEIAH